MARRTKLDDLTSKRITNALAAGTSRRAAAEAASVCQATLFDWLARGRDDEQPYAEFLERVERAEAGAEQKITDALFKSAKDGSVTAQIAWLERRRPADWAKRESPANLQNASNAMTDAVDDLALAESVVEAIKSRKVGA